MKRLIFLMSFIWGLILALFLQFHRLGQFLAIERTWTTVVAGIGIDLLLVLPLVSKRDWLTTVTVICLSSVPIISRSLLNEFTKHMRTMNDIEEPES